jgi:hypothetical protein
MNWTDPSESAGWGRACCDYEAERVAVNDTTGYLARHFDWWGLDWKMKDVGFELSAPVAALSMQDLISLAASVRP